MTTPDEGQVLQWFERALDRPEIERLAWLEAQALPDWLHLRVVRLLDAESKVGGFLEQPPAQPEPADFPKLGERLGNYQLIDRIDAGGMGVVYLARRADDTYEQQVALKLIRPLHLGANTGFRAQLVARFENERALLARLSHPNIARILDGGSTASGIPWLAMEYVQGTSLVEHCDRQALDVPDRLRLFRKVCDGVQEAHRHLIVHRDLKPENILVGADGEPKLLDFGIARMLDEDNDAGTVSLTSLTAMTPAYASPEQVRREPTTTRSDVYSLGVILYQLLAGTRPYELAGLSPAQAERTVCDTQPSTLRQALRKAQLDEGERRRRDAKLGADLERIVTKAMHKDVERRYGSAQELADDLQRHLDSKPVLAHPDSAGYRISKFVRRHRVSTALAATALIAIVSATTAVAWQSREVARAAADMRQVNAFLLDVLSMSDPYQTGSELTLSQALDGAAERIDEHFPDRPDLSATVRFGIGYSMLQRYRLDQAEGQLTRAFHDSEQVFGRDDRRTIRVIDGLANLRQEQGQPAQAEALYKDGIARGERAGLQADYMHLSLINNLGNLYMTESRWDEADKTLQRAMQVWQAHHDTGGLSEDRAMLRSNLAQVAHEHKQYAQADTLYREAQTELEALHPDGLPDIAIIMGNRGALAVHQHDFAGALALYRQSLAMRQRAFKSDHPSLVVGMARVARTELATGDAKSALDTAARAAAMADRVYASPNAWHATVYATLAEVEDANGNPERAHAALERAQAVFATLKGSAGEVTGYLTEVRERLCAKPGSDQQPSCI